MAARLSQALAAAGLLAAVSTAPVAAADRDAREPPASAAEAGERGRFVGRCGARNIRKLMAALAGRGPPETDAAGLSEEERHCASASLSLDAARAARSGQGLASGATAVGSERSPALVNDLQQLYRDGDVGALQARGRRVQQETAAGRQLNRVLERGDGDARALAGGPERLREVERRASARASDDGVLRHESCRQLPLQEESPEPQSCLAQAEIRDYDCDLHRTVRLDWQNGALSCPEADPSSWTAASYDEGGLQDRVGLRVPCEFSEEGQLTVDLAATEAGRRCGSLTLYQRRQLGVGATAQYSIRASFGPRSCQTVRVGARLECGLGGDSGRCRIQASFSRFVEVPAPSWQNQPTTFELRVIASIALNFYRPRALPAVSSSWDESSCALFDGLSEDS